MDDRTETWGNAIKGIIFDDSEDTSVAPPERIETTKVENVWVFSDKTKFASNVNQKVVYSSFKKLRNAPNLKMSLMLKFKNYSKFAL